MKKFFILIIPILLIGGLKITFVFANSEHSKSQLKEETDPKVFKILKEKSLDPRTGLPKTLDPHLFRDKAKRAYQIAKEIPQVLAQMPCFCGCEAFGHENLLDCFIDSHAAG